MALVVEDEVVGDGNDAWSWLGRLVALECDEFLHLVEVGLLGQILLRLAGRIVKVKGADFVLELELVGGDSVLLGRRLDEKVFARIQAHQRLLELGFLLDLGDVVL